MSDSSRTEKATPRRLQKAREEGRFPVSREFVASVQFAAFVGLLASQGTQCFDGLKKLTRLLLAHAFRSELTSLSLTAEIRQVVLPNLSGLALIGAALIVVTLSAQLATTQMGVALSGLRPDWKRLDPVQKLQSLPRQNFSASLQAAILLPAFLFAVWSLVAPNAQEFITLPFASLEAGSARVFSAVQGLLWKASFAVLCVGVVDLFRQRRRYAADLRMSQQEIREEHKELEGNPQIKARIRRIQRDLLRRNMMKEVPSATAVVTNPTHFAVAIRYTIDSAGAPTVVAKGKNYLAQRIKQRALDHNVPIVENPPLAQALYKSVDIGQEIPPNLYRAVAEVLAYIFRLSQRRR